MRDCEARNVKKASILWTLRNTSLQMYVYISILYNYIPQLRITHRSKPGSKLILIKNILLSILYKFLPFF